VVNKVLTIIVIFMSIIALLIVAQMFGKRINITELVDIRSEEQRAIVKESEEDIERIAAFVTHTTCVTNNKACAGPDVEWLTTCAFLGSQKFTGVSNTVNFRQAFTFAPYIDRAPYKLNDPETAPYYKLRLSGFANMLFDSVLESIEKAGHWGTYRRIKDQVVTPFLQSGTNAASFPAHYKEMCGRIVKMGRSNLGKLTGTLLQGGRGWPRNEVIQRQMREAGFVELVRITNDEALKNKPPGRVYGDPFIFYGRP